MPDHLQFSFPGLQPEQQDILVAHLAEIGFESFEEKENLLNAFVRADQFNEPLLHSLVFKYQLSYQQERIPEKNWNLVWESQFQPVTIGDFLGIRADFHSPIPGVAHEIIITPKMSFGTGHHATTQLMIMQMKEIAFEGRSLLDFGTGTGILAILAKKLGTSMVVAVDNDEWSIDNARENFKNNNVGNITLTSELPGEYNHLFDIILANINKNIILEHFIQLVGSLKKNGILLVSGILNEDQPEVNELAEKYDLKKGKALSQDNWCCLRFDY